MDRIEPYGAALAVRVAADESASGMSQGEFADRIYESIAGGRWRWDRAVSMAAAATACAQWAVVSLFSPEYGYGFAYFYVEPSGLVQLCLGGVFNEPIELPMPERDDMWGLIMAQRCGVVYPTVTVGDMIEWLTELARGQGLLPCPAGWDVDWGMIREQVDARVLGYERVVCGLADSGEDN